LWPGGFSEAPPAPGQREPANSPALERNLAGRLVLNRITQMANEKEGDAELMLRVKRGDEAAFRELVERYKQPVINVACRMLHDLSEAEDLAQNVFLQVYKSAPRYEVSAKFSTWIFTIVRNFCLNELRRRSRRPGESLEFHSEDGDEPGTRQIEDVRAVEPGRAVLREELDEKIQEALDALPETQRLAVILCRQDELSYEEMAKVLGCSLAATKSLIHRGRETLKARLKPYLRTGEWGEADEKSR
jgi:RNA polymerase sigma-70 factor (ECF subfamily)